MQHEIENKYISAFQKATQACPKEELRESFRKVKELMETFPHLTILGNHPLILPEKKKSAWKKILAQVLLHPRVCNFVLVLASHDRLPMLPFVIKELLFLLEEEEKITKALVTTATPLSSNQERSLAPLIQKMFSISGPLQIRTQVDPALLGGITIQAGSYWLDGSLKTSLKKIEKVIKG